MTEEKKYNIHIFLYDIFHIGTYHFKSKLLCKLGFHNYQLHGKIHCTPVVETELDPTLKYTISKTIRYEKRFEKYYECYCCKKKIELKGDE